MPLLFVCIKIRFDIILGEIRVLLAWPFQNNQTITDQQSGFQNVSTFFFKLYLDTHYIFLFCLKCNMENVLKSLSTFLFQFSTYFWFSGPEFTKCLPNSLDLQTLSRPFWQATSV